MQALAGSGRPHCMSHGSKSLSCVPHLLCMLARWVSNCLTRTEFDQDRADLKQQNSYKEDRVGCNAGQKG